MRLRRERSAPAARDEAEFESYVASDGGRLLGFALLLAGNYQDAEDLVQVALLRLASRWPAARQNPQGYARTILVNLARDRWRVRRRRQPETLVADAARLPCGAAHDGAAAVLERQVLLCACRLLPTAQRAVLVLRLTYDGTAHVGRGTVVGGIVELSAGTGRPLRTLLLEHAAHSADPGQPGWYIGPCQVAAADRTGSHLLVSCDRFGRLDRGRFTAVPGAAPQAAVAAAW